MKKILLAFIIFCASASSVYGAEPVKRQTAGEIYSILFEVPYKASTEEVYKLFGRPETEKDDYMMYQYQRTQNVLIIYKTPFNTVQSALYYEPCESPLDATARLVLLSGQFQRRFGNPVESGEDFYIWNIDDVALLSLAIGEDDSIVCRLEPF